MKFLILFFSLTVFCVAAQDSATVRFADGEQLSGNVVALNLQNLTWQSELLKENADFKVDKIRDLDLPSKLDTNLALQASHEAVLQLSNGDTVKGQLAGLNDKEIHLKTWYAGNMVFRRINVKSITISRASKVIYSGPSGIEDWKVLGDNSWAFNQGELISKSEGAIGREVNFTDDVQITYNISWKGMLKSKLLLFTSDINNALPQSGYEVSFQGSLVGIKRLSDNNRLRIISNPTRIQPRDNVRVDIRVSRQSEKIMLYMDDVLHATWFDDQMADTQGKGFMYLSDASSQLKLSNILISEWDGYVDETANQDQDFENQGFGIQFRRVVPASPPKPKELPDGRMLLANGDTIEGEVLGVENEIIKVKTPFTEVKFPIHRLKNIALNKEGAMEEAIKKKGDVRGLLADGSALVFRLEDVKDGKIVGYSQNFGTAEFLLSAFKRIEFNCHFRDK